MTRKRLLTSVLSLVVIIGLAASLYADVPNIEVPIDGMEVVRVGSPIDRVVLGSSDFARARVVTGQQIMLFGLNAGSTTMHVWTEAGIRKFQVQVANVTREGVKDESESLLRDLGEVDAEGKELRTFVPEYRQISEFEQYINQLLRDEGEIVMADEASGKLFVLGPTELLDNIENLLEEVDVPSGEEVYTRQINVTNRPVKELKPKVEDLLSDKGTITIDEETNSLLVVDKVNNVKKIENYVKNIDVQTETQVRITSRFVEMTDDAKRNLGIEWEAVGSADGEPVNVDLLPENVVSNGLTAEVNRNVSSGNRIRAQIEALEAKNEAKLISSPNVVTRNQQQAQLEIIDEQNYTAACDLSFDDDGNVTTVTPQVEKIESGITLEVTPSIGKNKDVVQLDLKPELSEVSGLSAGDGITQGSGTTECTFFTPEKNSRTVDINVAIEDGKTLVIGGLKETQERNAEDQVPFFGDIPILGHAFGTNTNIDDSTNISIFLTVEVMEVNPSESQNKSDTSTTEKIGRNDESSEKSTNSSQAVLD